MVSCGILRYGRWIIRIISYASSRGGPSRVGILSEDGTHFRQAVWPNRVPVDTIQSILDAPEQTQDITTTGDLVALDDVVLLAPFPTPRYDIICVGKNYGSHAKEFNESGFDSSDVDIPEKPVFFSKSSGSVIGPMAPINAHLSLTSMLDYESELAVIIGHECRNVNASHVSDVIWGYTIINDVTARDLQRDYGQWYFGKSLDTFCPMGPLCITADEMSAESVQITTHVNGELRQCGSTADLLFGIPQLISILSQGITLKPGQIISTGTPSGVGAGFVPPRFLKPGDTVTVEVEGIGSLTNQVKE